MERCSRCGSFAINHHSHGRDGSDPDLCDVCYWRKRAEFGGPIVTQPLTDEQIEAAAQALALCMDYPWQYMPAQGRNEMRKNALMTIVAACGIKKENGNA